MTFPLLVHIRIVTTNKQRNKQKMLTMLDFPTTFFYAARLFVLYRGVARIFQRGGGGGSHCVKDIAMAFSPRNIVGCLLKKGLQRGFSGTRGFPPSYALVVDDSSSYWVPGGKGRWEKDIAEGGVERGEGERYLGGNV